MIGFAGRLLTTMVAAPVVAGVVASTEFDNWAVEGITDYATIPIVIALCARSNYNSIADQSTRNAETARNSTIITGSITGLAGYVASETFFGDGAGPHQSDFYSWIPENIF